MNLLDARAGVRQARRVGLIAVVAVVLLSVAPTTAGTADAAFPPPFSPARLLETRSGPGLGTVDGQFDRLGIRAGGTVTSFQVRGRAGVPVFGQGSTAMLVVTAVTPATAGFLTVYACDTVRPTAANLNFVAGRTTSNAVLTALSGSGSACVYTSGSTDLVVDVTGFRDADPALRSPARLLDTRTDGSTTIDGQASGLGIRASGTLTTLQVRGRGGVPSGFINSLVGTVTLNVAATGATSPGYLTVFPCDAPRPIAANLHYTVGETVSNLVVTAMSALGTVCIYTYGTTHIVVDVSDATPASLALAAPARFVDTRIDGSTTIDGKDAGIGIRAAGTVTTVQILGRGGLPATHPMARAAVVLSVTVTMPTGAGFITVYPCDAGRPNAANTTYVAGDTIAATVFSELTETGAVCVFTSGSTHLVVDVLGLLD